MAYVGNLTHGAFQFVDCISHGLEILVLISSNSHGPTYISDITNGLVHFMNHLYQFYFCGNSSLENFIDLAQGCTGAEASVCMLPDLPGNVPYTFSPM